MLDRSEYRGVDQLDPIKFYFFPVLGRLYRRRIEMCLEQLTGGKRVLEVGFGSGVTFMNLNEIYDEIYGIDLKAKTVEISKLFSPKGISTNLVNGDVCELPYEDDFFDSVLLVSILEHIRPNALNKALNQIHRVIKPGGQMVYGVPIDGPFMTAMFRILGYNIHKHHFSTEDQISNAASGVFTRKRLLDMKQFKCFRIYQVGVFQKKQ